MSQPVALIPLNRLSMAKGRLAEALTANHRAELAAATCRIVAIAARDAGLRVVVLAAEPRDVPAQPGVDVMPEAPGLTGLNPQLSAALGALAAPEVLVLHADLPLATAEAISSLIEAAPPAPSVTLVRSRDGGTNAMLLRPPGKFELAYGAGSFDRHVAAAQAAGMQVKAVESDVLALDLDTPDDIEAFLQHPGSVGSPVRELLEVARGVQR